MFSFSSSRSQQQLLLKPKLWEFFGILVGCFRVKTLCSALQLSGGFLLSSFISACHGQCYLLIYALHFQLFTALRPAGRVFTRTLNSVCASLGALNARKSSKWRKGKESQFRSSPTGFCPSSHLGLLVSLSSLIRINLLILPLITASLGC